MKNEQKQLFLVYFGFILVRHLIGRVDKLGEYGSGLLLVDLYTKPKCNFISFKILGGGGGLFTMIATSGVSWG